MKIIHFADLHLDAPFRLLPQEAARHRRQMLRDTLDAIVDLAIDEQADALTCGGDLYEHEMVAPDTGDVIRAAFARLDSTPVFVAPGNHDWLGSQSVYRRTEWSSNVHVFRTARMEPVELVAGVWIWGAAHEVPANTPNVLAGFRVDRDGINIGLFHGSLRSWLSSQDEGKAAHAAFDAVDVEAAGLDHALLGHLHSPLDEQRLTYPGNPFPLSFGETGDRGVVRLEISDGGIITTTRVSVARTSVYDIAVDITGCGNGQEIREVVRGQLAGITGCVRLTINGELEPSIVDPLKGLDQVATHLDALVVRPGHITDAYDTAALARQAGTVKGRFVAEVSESTLDPEVKRRVIAAGLRALDGRRDLEVV